MAGLNSLTVFDLAERARDREHILSEPLQIAGVPAHQSPDHIDRTQDQIDETRRHSEPAFTHRSQAIFNRMRDITDHLESDRVGGTFQRVRRAEQMLDALGILGSLLQPKQESFHDLEVFLRLWRKVRQRFGIG